MAGVADANTALATPTTPPGRRPEPLAPLPGPRLFKGSKGADVADLRAALRILGYLDAREDSASEQVFGTGTRDAVIRFQRDRGLAPDGIVGPQLLAEFKSLARVRGVSP
jgi:peptidoglycan hydrolase-like protein with peptidoglycan-binding domain